MGPGTSAPIAVRRGPQGASDVASLIEQIKCRDAAALRSLYLAYSTRVHSYAFQLLRDEHAAQDVVHDVFIRVWRYAASYDASRAVKPEAWLFQITRNTALDEVLHRTRMVHAEAEDTMPPADDDEGNESGTRLADRADTRSEAFGQALEGLPSHCRQVLHLRFHQGLSNPEIAKHLGIPVGTAKTWLRRGLLQMRERLNVAVAGEAQREEWV